MTEIAKETITCGVKEEERKVERKVEESHPWRKAKQA